MIEINKNSYVSIQEADEYFATKLEASLWPTDDTIKEKALIEATRELELYRYRGYKLQSTQELSFPRVNLGRELTEAELIIYGSSNAYVPKEVKWAQLEQAYHLLKGPDETMELMAKGVTSFSAGGASMSFSKGNFLALAPTTKRLLTPFLSQTGVII